MIGGGSTTTYRRMVVCKSIVNGHFFEEPTDMLVEEPLNFIVVVLGVDKDGANVGFDDIREGLNSRSILIVGRERKQWIEPWVVAWYLSSSPARL